MKNDDRTLSQRWADAVTEFSGSWPFIGWFAAICAVWILVNTIGPMSFDAYPFLFLNWTLTIVSTFQSPLILMSQNRQNEMDRARETERDRQLTEILMALDKLQVRSS